MQSYYKASIQYRAAEFANAVAKNGKMIFGLMKKKHFALIATPKRLMIIFLIENNWCLYALRHLGAIGGKAPVICFLFFTMSIPRFISLSGGVESSTMCLLYGRGATAIWCDTGDEHDETYERINFLDKALTDFHGGDFRLHRIKPSPKIKGRIVNSLSEGIKAFTFMPSPNARYCTSRFKIEPIEAFLKEQGTCEVLIGLNADEEPGSVRIGNFEKLKNVNYRYPLHEEGLDRADCEEILIKHGLHPNFPIYMSRGGCKFCFYKSKAEYKALYLLDRKTFMEGWDLERSVQDRRKKYFSILPNTTFAAIALEVENEVMNWGEQAVIEFYRPQAQTKVCGVFCHR